MIRRWPIFFFFCVLSIEVCAQQPSTDTIPPTRDTSKFQVFTRFFTEGLAEKHPDSLLRSDTMPYLPHRFERGASIETFTRNTGNFGSPSHILYYSSPQNPGFRSGINQFNIYTRRPEDIKYFVTATPYTFLSYTQGAATGNLQLQKIEALHTRNINKQWNFGLRYHRFNSPGSYFREAATHTNGEIFTHYRSVNQRYRIFASGIVNRFGSEENGGLADPEGFDTTKGVARTRTPVTLQQAGQIYQDYYVRVRQFYYLGNYRQVKQQPEDTFFVQQLQPAWQLSHTINYNRQNYEYIDRTIDSGFYPMVLFDSTGTHDSLHVRILENEFRLATSEYNPLIRYRKFVPYLAVYARHRYIHAGQQYLQSRRNEITAGAELHNEKGLLHFGGKAEMLVRGSNSGNYFFNAWAGFSLLNITTGGGIEIKKYDADHIYGRYISNHHFWLQNFSPLTEQAFKVFSKSKRYKFSAEGEARRIDNLVYVNSNLQPQQYTNALSYFMVKVRKYFSWRSLTLAAHLLYQAADNDTLLSFPRLATKTSFFWQGEMFKGALFAQAGFDIDYTTGYTSPAYFPTTGMEYVQKEEQTEGYPFVNFFVSGKVKTFTAFVALWHANQGISGSRYFSYPLYPQSPRNFRFGITWRFYN